MKKILFFLFTSLSVSGFAQPLSIEVMGGLANYQGDFKESRYTFQGARPMFGAGVGYAFTDHISVRAMIHFSSLRADDKDNKENSLRLRNLNFRTNLFEFNVMGQYFIFSQENARINPYLTAGVAVFHYNPYTFDSTGAKYYLQPLSTEGQGLAQYPDREPYKLTQFAIPFGAGIRFRVTQNIDVGWEIALRKTFTDYLDDLSKTYVDENVLRASRGDKAVELAYRSGELKDGNPIYPDAGITRGSAKSKDWYYFSGITATFRLADNGALFNGGKKSRTGCPTPVF